METFQKIREQQEGHKGRGRERDVGGDRRRRRWARVSGRAPEGGAPAGGRRNQSREVKYCRERGTDTTERRQRNRERGNEGKGDRVSCFGARW